MNAGRIPTLIAGAVLVGSILACINTAELETELKELEPYLAEVKAKYSEPCKPLFEEYKATEDEFEAAKHWAPERAPKYINSKTAVYGHFSSDSENRFQHAWVRLNYAGADWIFFDTVIIKADETKITLKPKTERDHKGGQVGEWANFPTSNKKNEWKPTLTLADLKAIGSAEKVVVRFSGKRQHDHELSTWEKKSFTDISCFREMPSDFDLLDEARELRKQQEETGE